MKILITGGAGFIGTNLARLLCDNNEVICLDNLLSGYAKNLEGLNIEFIKQDIRHEIKLNNIDQIYNLACPASPVFYQKYPIDTLECNSIGMKNVLELALKNNAILVHTSTSEIYGDPSINPQPESYWGNVNPNGIRSCYDEGKRYAESLIMTYFREKQVNAKIVRLFNTYGPYMRLDDGRVVSNFISQALRNEPITVYGNGKQTRSFCFVNDTIDALTKVMTAKAGSIYNIGNPNERTILSFAEYIKNEFNPNSKIEFKELPCDDPRQRKPDITKIKNELSWTPKVQFEDGLKITADWLKEQLGK